MPRSRAVCLACRILAATCPSVYVEPAVRRVGVGRDLEAPAEDPRVRDDQHQQVAAAQRVAVRLDRDRHAAERAQLAQCAIEIEQAALEIRHAPGVLEHRDVVAEAGDVQEVAVLDAADVDLLRRAGEHDPAAGGDVARRDAERLREVAAGAARHQAEARGLAIPPVSAFEAVPGFGVHARVDGREVAIGAERFMRRLGADPAAGTERARSLAEQARSPLYVAIDGRLAAVLAVADPVRPTAAAVVSALHERG